MSLVLGLGVGTFVLIVVSIVSLLTCYLFSSTVYNRLVFIIALAIPVLLLILFVISPKGSGSQPGELRDWNFLSRILLAIALCVGAVLGVSLLVQQHFLVQRKWRPPRSF